MRFLTAAVLFVIALALGLVGVAQQTIWLPPKAHVITLETSGTEPLMVVSHSALSLFPGNPSIQVSGSEKVFVATGRESDISAWVGQTNHRMVGVKGRQLVANSMAGGGLPANPAGSDLWRFETESQTSVETKLDVSQDGAVLIATDGTQPAPTEIQLTWRIPFDATWSRILVYSGLGFLLLAILVNIWAWYSMRKERGPRRRTPKPPRGPKYRYRASKSNVPVRGRRSTRNAKVAIGLVASVAFLGGCASPASNPSPTPSVSPSENLQPAVVTTAQVERIVNRIAAVVKRADQSKDAKQLASRVTGPAFNARQAHYALQGLGDKIKSLQAINADEISFVLPAATTQWPRTVMAVTAAQSEADLPQMLVLEQEGPRSPYILWYLIDMLPGVQTPEVAAADIGAIPVAPDSKFLKLSPNALPTAFGNLIDLGTASLSAPSFDLSNDEFYKQVAAAQAQQISSLKKAKVTVSHTLGNANVLSLSTANSGALVAVYMIDTYVIKPTKRNSAVAVSGNEKLLLGSTGSTTGIRSVYGDMLLFYVPAVSSKDRIVTLGATQGLLSVRSL